MASMTLGQIKAHVMRLCGAHADPIRAEMAIALKLIEIGETRSWSWRKAQGLIRTVAPHSEGTIALNVDPTKIDGSGTAFAAGDIGRFIRISQELTYYKITNVVGQQLTLEAAYAGSAFTGSGYTIFQHIYALAADFGQMEVPYFYNRIRETTLTELAEWDARLAYSDTPSHFAFVGRDSSGNQQVQLWPTPSAVIGARYAYLKSLPVVTGDTTRIECRPDVLIYQAAADVLYTLIVEKPERFAVLNPIAQRYEEKGVKAQDEYVVEDQRRAGIPAAIRDYGVTDSFTNTFDDSFDVSFL